MAGQGAEAESRVLDANESFYRAFNNKDQAAMELIWSERTDIACVHPGWNLLRGREEVIASWEAILANPNQARIVVGSTSVSFAGSAAVVTCRELVAGSPLAATNVYIEEQGTWKLLHHQSGPVSALAQNA